MADDMTFRELDIVRVFDAPRELVWHAWTDPDQIAQWWGPAGMHTPRASVEMDVRPGGVFRLTMVMTETGAQFPSDMRFTEVVEPERLGFGIGEDVAMIVAGNEFEVIGSGDVTVAGGIGVEADLQVKANEDGSYTVSGAVEADLGLKLLAGASLGAGGKVEFTFPNQEEALKATESLVLAGSPLLAPSGGDLERLANHVSAVELSSKAAASLDDALKLGDTSPFSADVESGITYRLEIEDGKPVALSREQHLTGNVSADLASVAFKNVDATAMLNFAEARATANVSVSTRLRLPDDIGSLSDVLQTGVFIADPTGGLSNLLPNAQTSIKGSLDVSAGGSPRVGAEATFEVPDVELTDGLSIANNLAQGRLAEALQGLPEVKLFGNTYKETGFLVDGGMKIAGQGIELNLNNAIKDVQTKFEVTV